MQALLVSGGTTGQAYRVPFAYGAYANTPADVTFDVGFAAILGVKSAAFRDDTNAVTSYVINGSHTDGIDLSGGTYSGSQIKLKGGVAYTPTVTANAGTYTTVSAAGHYILLGKLLFFSLTITQTAVGTASGILLFSLPLSLTARDATALEAWDSADNSTCTARLTAGSGVVNVTHYDGNTIIINGHFIVVSGWIEVN